MSLDARDALLAGLDEAEAAFEAGDAVAASEKLDGVVAACASLEREGVQLDAALIQEARRRWLSCTASAERTARDLAERMHAAGTARRAAGAYRTS